MYSHVNVYNVMRINPMLTHSYTHSYLFTHVYVSVIVAWVAYVGKIHANSSNTI